MSEKNRLVFALSLVLLISVGCSGGKVGLSGKVVYSDDKSPLPTGTVCLETDTFMARGTIGPNGTFVVGSVGEKDGLPPGKYRVFISGAEKVVSVNDNDVVTTEPLIDPKFTSGVTSGLTLDITSTTRNFNIEVDRYDRR